MGFQTGNDKKQHLENIYDTLQSRWEFITLCFNFQGKVEMTIELLEKKEAESKPVGLGREAPNNHPRLENPQ